MEKESHGAASRDMIVAFGRLIEDGEDGIYGFGKRFDRIGIIKEDIGARVIEIEGRKTKFWSWEIWFGMWTIGGTAVANLCVRASGRALETRSTYLSFLSFHCSSFLLGWASLLG